MTKRLPEVFIGSSGEGEDVARAIELHLQRHANTTLWMNGVFRPGVSFLQSLLAALDKFDFAVLVLTPDDVLESRDDSYSSPRDNVVFELGLFMGRLGVRRAFFVAEESEILKLPSDLDGISRLEYRRRGDIQAAVSPACTVLIDEIRKQGHLDASAGGAKDSRAGLAEPLSEEERQLRLLAREFFQSPLARRQEVAARVSEIGFRVPLDRVLLMSDSVLPGERVAAGLALASHIRRDPSLAASDAVTEAIGRGLDDSRSRVRYRFVEVLAQAPLLARRFGDVLKILLQDESNEAVRLMATQVLNAIASRG